MTMGLTPLRWIVFCVLLGLALPGQATNDVELLGDTENTAFDAVKAVYLANTLNALLESCTVATRVDTIPAASYKGVRLTRPDGTHLEAHIFPDSLHNYRVMIYTRQNGTIRLHGKYSDHAYQLIAMLELKAEPLR